MIYNIFVLRKRFQVFFGVCVFQTFLQYCPMECLFHNLKYTANFFRKSAMLIFCFVIFLYRVQVVFTTVVFNNSFKASFLYHFVDLRNGLLSEFIWSDKSTAAFPLFQSTKICGLNLFHDRHGTFIFLTSALSIELGCCSYLTTSKWSFLDYFLLLRFLLILILLI